LKLPRDISGEELAALLRRYGDGPHCITWTHADEVNAELVNFLGKAATQRAV